NQQRLCPLGVMGEICVGGDGVALGYIKRDDLTKEVFLANPFQSEVEKKANQNARIYRTGDLGRWNQDGLLEYGGRNDFQVKIKGIRIELGEVESRLSNIESVDNALVVALEDDNQAKYLCGYYVSKSEIDGQIIRDEMSEHLAAYMIPDYFVWLVEFPLTVNGKIDRKGLPKPDKSSGEVYIAPSTEEEKLICEAFAEVLGIEEVGVKSNFFQLGGNSLKMIKLVSRLQQHFEVSVVDVFQHKTPESLANLNKASGPQKLIEKVNPREYYPVSFAQERLYVASQIAGVSVLYNIPFHLKLVGNLDVNRLHQAFVKLSERYSSLRTKFQYKNSEIVQIVTDSIQGDDNINLEGNKTIKSNIESEFSVFVQPFNLMKDNLFRVKLLEVKPQEHYLFLDFHHIIFDGESIDPFLNDLSRLYAGENLTPLEVDYTDYAVWQREGSGLEVFQEHKNYWLNQFSTIDIDQLNLPLDFKRTDKIAIEGKTLIKQLSETLLNNLQKLNAKEQLSLYSLCLSAFALLLNRYSNQNQLIIGCPVSGRSKAELQESVGMFVNTLPLPFTIDQQQSSHSYLHQVQKSVLGLIANQEYQMEDLIDELKLSSEGGRNPLFDVVFNFLEASESVVHKNKDELQFIYEHEPESEEGEAKFDLSLDCEIGPDGLNIMFNYRTSLFRKETIQKMLTHYINILQGITNINHIYNKLSTLEILSKAEKHKILNEFNSNKSSYPSNKSFIDLFETAAAKYPENFAVISGTKKYTYYQLLNLINYVAISIEKYFINSEQIIPISVNRNESIIVFALAIQKLGGAYIFIDPSLPKDRREYLADESDSKIILVDDSSIDAYGNFNCESICFESFLNKINSDEIYHLKSKAIPKGLFGIITTSGSTGLPKGSMIEHRNFINFAYYYNELMGITNNSQIASYASFSFDVSIATNFTPLVCGATVHIIQSEIRMDISKLSSYFHLEKITHTFFPTPIGELYMKEANTTASLVAMAIGGEQLKYFKKQTYKVINAYSPSECTVAILMGEVATENSTEITLGQVQANNKVYILDENFNICPIGVSGELYIGGDQVGRGYYKNIEITNERFIEHESYGRIYKSGDLCKWTDTGEVVYLGRIDFQVKISGYRIELGEIENRILEIPEINDAIVLALDDDTGNKVLCGYYESKEEIEKTIIKAKLQENLPEYMVPNFFIHLTKFSLTPNEKVDRKALPSPNFTVSMEVYFSPSTEEEKLICKAFGEILGIDEVSVKSNFFQLGGNSLKMIKLVSKLQQHFEVSVVDVFQHKTPESLAKLSKASGVQQIIKKVKARDYYPVSFAQERMFITDQVLGENVVYNIPLKLRIDGDLDRERLGLALDNLIKRYQSLRLNFGFKGEKIVQTIKSEIEIKKEFEKINKEEIDSEFESFIQPFDLEKDVLFRVKLLKVNSQTHYLLLDLHHIIFDGGSIEPMLEDLSKLYSGVSLPELEVDYTDYAVWQREEGGLNVFQKHKSYWLNQFNDLEVESLNLPMDITPKEKVDGDTLSENISTEVLDRLSQIATQEQISIYSLCLSAYVLLLNRYSGQDILVIGCLVNGRSQAELQESVGMFVNTLPLPFSIDKTQSIHSYLHQVQKSVLGFIANQEYQMEDLINELKLSSEGGRNPLFDVVFDCVDARETIENKNELQFIHEIDNEETDGKFNLSLDCEANPDGLNVMFNYRKSLFAKETIQGILSHYVQILTEISSLDLSASMTNDITLLSKPESKYLVEELNQ
ncbi:MAG: amino acid adenylation domain-containing protein, partial [Francisellaceae bacterium]